MIKLFSIKLIVISLIYVNSSLAQVNNTIIAKIDKEIITSHDLHDEIKTIMLINKIEITKDNFLKNQKIAFNALIRKNIKKIEIKKYNISEFNNSDLNEYLRSIEKKLNIPNRSLKLLFEQNKLSYVNFVEDAKIDFLWNTLIFQLYSNQLSVNTVEIENELLDELNNTKNKIEYEISEIEILRKENSTKTLKEIKQFLKNNSFESAVAKYSVSPSATNQGSLGWLEENKLNNIYKNKIQSIKVGQVTDPIETTEGFVLLKLKNKKVQSIKETDAKKIKDQIITRKKNEKLSLFSRSHFANIKNSIYITIK